MGWSPGSYSTKNQVFAKDTNSSPQMPSFTHPRDRFESGLGLPNRTQTWPLLQDSDSSRKKQDFNITTECNYRDKILLASLTNEQPHVIDRD